MLEQLSSPSCSYSLGNWEEFIESRSAAMANQGRRSCKKVVRSQLSRAATSLRFLRYRSGRILSAHVIFLSHRRKEVTRLEFRSEMRADEQFRYRKDSVIETRVL